MTFSLVERFRCYCLQSSSIKGHGLHALHSARH